MAVDVMLDIVEPFQDDLIIFKSEFTKLLTIFTDNNILYSVTGNIAVSYYRVAPQACHDIEIQLLSKAHKKFMKGINESKFNIEYTPSGFVIHSKQVASLSHHCFSIIVNFIDALPFHELKVINQLPLFGITKLPVLDVNSLALQTLFAYSNANKPQNKRQLSLNLLDLIITNKLNRALLTKILESISCIDLLKLLNDSYVEYEKDKDQPSMTWEELQSMKKKRGY